MIEWGTPIAVISAVIGFGGALFTAFRYFVASIENTRREAGLIVDKQAALDSKARHDTANAVTAALGELKSDVERLNRETVKREEMAALEARLQVGQAKIEAKVDKMDEKIDRLLMRRQEGHD